MTPWTLKDGLKQILFWYLLGFVCGWVGITLTAFAMIFIHWLNGAH